MAMRNSNSHDDHGSQSDEQLPKEWGYLSKRLEEVERGLSLLERKCSKLDKKISNYTREVGDLNAQLTEEVLSLKTNMPSKIEIKEDIIQNFQAVEREIKRACLDTLTNRLENYTLSLHQRNDSIQVKIKSMYQQTKSYVDRAVLELKQILKKYVKEQNELQKKFQKSSRENSPSMMPRTSLKNSLNKSKSAKKLMHESIQKQQNSDNLELSNGWLSKSRGNLAKETSQQVSPNGGNRVSYLRQKLKEFEKINKKYEAMPDKIEPKRDQEDMMKKMRNYRDYLEQSQSELEPSNILSSDEVTGYSQKKPNYALF